MKKIGAALVIAGMILISTTFVAEWHNKAKQKEILRIYENEVQSNSDAENWDNHAVGIDGKGKTNEVLEIDGEGTVSDPTVTTIENYDVAGVLTIEKIDLETPVLIGASDGNLKISVATVLDRDAYLESNNLVIAGHNWKEYGRGFNRLYELEKGDVILFSDSTMDYRYSITEKFIAEEDDLWVLNDSEDKREITLITCVFGGDKRRIIKGVCVDEIEREAL